MLDAKIASIRLNYQQSVLLEENVQPNAIEQFNVWWQDALLAKVEEVNAMVLSTVDDTNQPDSRIVLLKTITQNSFVFFTNYNSTKGKQIANNPKVSLNFFWKELERQVRIIGIAQKISEKDNNEYFFSRPISSQIGAIASKQSTIIPNRKFIDDNYKKLENSYLKTKIEKPTEWGGYEVIPTIIEFWQGRASRLHDRLCYTKQSADVWKIDRLSP